MSSGGSAFESLLTFLAMVHLGSEDTCWRWGHATTPSTGLDRVFEDDRALEALRTTRCGDVARDREGRRDRPRRRNDLLQAVHWCTKHEADTLGQDVQAIVDDVELTDLADGAGLSDVLRLVEVLLVYRAAAGDEHAPDIDARAVGDFRTELGAVDAGRRRGDESAAVVHLGRLVVQ